ncbi:MAG: hypothetical protein HN833_04375 [Elusimicrobiaceae bacterium]|jgi:hypothetical protein|nr:hypothetical protein [Elusimicrobiaceae bacterium]MBT3954639.1 hypothetical protein [Elusimicrobiaceae bacterium]MBT4007947.1 hypothetical protein [Elusimicrobiaceae bacterium]MBT4403302.1 hypothetical protein [Elusimicrobiaceae bacterium]MBT4439961.1 hypothetical protein [Elusimicrobiaceae bacterium]
MEIEIKKIRLSFITYLTTLIALVFFHFKFTVLLGPVIIGFLNPENLVLYKHIVKSINMWTVAGWILVLLPLIGFSVLIYNISCSRGLKGLTIALENKTKGEV